MNFILNFLALATLKDTSTCIHYGLTTFALIFAVVVYNIMFDPPPTDICFALLIFGLLLLKRFDLPLFTYLLSTGIKIGFSLSLSLFV